MVQNKLFFLFQEQTLFDKYQINLFHFLFVAERSDYVALLKLLEFVDFAESLFNITNYKIKIV